MNKPGTFFSKKNIDTQVGVLQAAIDFINTYSTLKTEPNERPYLKALQEYQKTFNAVIANRKQKINSPIETSAETDASKSPPSKS